MHSAPHRLCRILRGFTGILKDPSGFASLEETDPITVYLADNTDVPASKQANLWLDFSSGVKQSKCKTRLVLKRVFFIPEAALSMLSCTQLGVMGISTVFSEGKCLFSDEMDGGRPLAQAEVKYSDGLHGREGIFRPEKHLSLLASKSNVKSGRRVDPWHKRLGQVAKAVQRMMAERTCEEIRGYLQS